MAPCRTSARSSAPARLRESLCVAVHRAGKVQQAGENGAAAAACPSPCYRMQLHYEGRAESNAPCPQMAQAEAASLAC